MPNITIWYDANLWIIEGGIGLDKAFARPEDALEAVLGLRNEMTSVRVGVPALAKISRLLREGSSAVAAEKPPTAQVVIAALEALRDAELERGLTFLAMFLQEGKVDTSSDEAEKIAVAQRRWRNSIAEIEEAYARDAQEERKI